MKIANPCPTCGLLSWTMFALEEMVVGQESTVMISCQGCGHTDEDRVLVAAAEHHPE